MYSYGVWAMLARRQDDDNAATRFRSDRLFEDDGAWYFFTREGSIEGPFRDQGEAGSRLDTYITVVNSGLLPGGVDLSAD